MWVVLVNDSDYITTAEGVLVYLNAGSDVQTTLGKVPQHNGAVLTPIMQVNEYIGYIDIFIDTEGNKIGIHTEQYFFSNIKKTHFISIKQNQEKQNPTLSRA